MNTNQTKARILQAMDETIRGLERAQRYSPEFQDRKLIASYEAHLEKLNKMIEELAK